MINCKIPKTAVIGMTAVLLCECAGQKALDAEPPASAQEVLEETAEGAVAECITEFHGTITVNEKPEPVDLYYYQESENEYFYELDVGGQSITVPMRDDLLPSSLSGFEICDVNRDGEEIEVSIKGRHDPIIVPRAVVVVEAMAAFAAADLLLANMTARMDRIQMFYAMERE